MNAAELCVPCAAVATGEADEKRQLQQRIERAREVREIDERTLKAIILTTESDSNLNIVERIEVITVECALGMNLFRDFFAGVCDVFGGRSKSTQTVLRDTRKKVLEEFRKEAFSVGANAVVGIALDYSEFSGGGESMLFVVASGTAVRVET